ncbi:sulfite exporter TauE/SafE family protein [Flavobacterium sp.]|uniref:sulfite exporter TauE/SafE family protein n=1 Tax=Flavobacterium sp. TaxID=239 RepID=UPI003529BBAA
MLYTAIILGLISSLHCIGMCGPIALMLPVDRKNEAKKTLQIITYHLGRLTAYGSLGLLFGSIGKGLFIGSWQQQISIAIGIIMILIALVPEKEFAKYNLSKPIYKILSKIKVSLGKQFKKKTFGSIFTIGLLNGYLPCGMVYVALFGALSMGTIAGSFFYMVLFGMGTIPLMSIVVYVANLLTTSVRSKLQKVIPYVIVTIGMLFILRGLALGIPYISPKNVDLFVQSEANCH